MREKKKRESMCEQDAKTDGFDEHSVLRPADLIDDPLSEVGTRTTPLSHRGNGPEVFSRGPRTLPVQLSGAGVDNRRMFFKRNEG